MLDDVLKLGPPWQGQRLRMHTIRVATPILAGVCIGLCLVLADIRPTYQHMALWSFICGVSIAAILIGCHRGKLSKSHLVYLVDWFLLFGACLGAAWLNG